MENKEETRFDKHVRRAENVEGVPSDKFDRHMVKARRSDLESRRNIFIAQAEADEQTKQKTKGIVPSVY